MTISEKELRRIPDEGMLAGVTAGLAEWLDFSLWAVRAVLIVMLLIHPFIVVAGYILLAVLLPVADSPQPPPAPGSNHDLDTLEVEMRLKRENWDQALRKR